MNETQTEAARTPPGTGGASGDIADLVEGLRGGRMETWGQLYRLTHLPLLRFLTARLGESADPALAALNEDLLQAIFVTAIENIGKFDPQKGTVDVWLVGIARNKVKEARGAAARDSVRQVAVSDVAEAADERQRGRTNGPGGSGPRAAVLAALDELEPRYAEVLRRKYLLNQSLAEIAAALGFNLSTVGIWLYRGRDKFRQAYLRKQQGSGAARAKVADGAGNGAGNEGVAPAGRAGPPGGQRVAADGGSVLHWPRPNEAHG